jgi:large subunit ribosomal protein L20
MNLARGYRGGKSCLLRTAIEAIERGWIYAYRDRRQRKRDFRGIWIARINAGARLSGISYSKLIHALKEKNINLDRKMLADIALTDPKTFDHIVKTAIG